MIFSQDSETCKRCKYYDDCDNKRMEMCAVINPSDTNQPTLQEEAGCCSEDVCCSAYQETVIQPGLRTKDGIYLTEQIRKEIERELNCSFMFGA